MKQAFTTGKLYAKSRALLGAINRILEGEPVLSVRRLHYALVTMSLRGELEPYEHTDRTNKWRHYMVPWKYENTKQRYSALTQMVTTFRDQGLIDWDAVVDSMRERNVPVICDSTRQAVEEGIEQWFELDRWAEQPRRVELWTEKAGSETVLDGLRRKYQLPFQANRGRLSTTLIQSAARELPAGTVVFYVGDHDPCGVDMDRDIKTRLKFYKAARGVQFKRLALTMKQIEQLELPPAFTKPGDELSPAYKAKFGDRSWEVEALPNAVLLAAVEKAVTGEIDQNAWDAVETEERERKDAALAIIKRVKGLD